MINMKDFSDNCLLWLALAATSKVLKLLQLIFVQCFFTHCTVPCNLSQNVEGLQRAERERERDSGRIWKESGICETKEKERGRKNSCII